ncbi:MAG: beta-ketoacyl synthase N-terminal-like domain-containing protein, partial [Bacteroides sp.]|nr:beta-ketoacyl synthase N-terminal-like domain-containing protein [Bacteroides sp.]
MIKVSDYIVSPLALGTHANYECVKAGKTQIHQYVGKWGLPEPFMASMMDDSLLDEACRETGISPVHYTRFERMAILAAARALQGTHIRPENEKVMFIIATTKGNVELLNEKAQSAHPAPHLLLTEAARHVTAWFRNPNNPLVVCNACISGLSAQLEAKRMLDSGVCDYAIVIGADVLSPFIVSGFQSFKATSDSQCRPFDEDRNGLNLGEAAACIIYSRTNDHCTGALAATTEKWYLADGAVRNDAFHISGPSRTAEGAYRALKYLFDHCDTSDLAFVNVHGTATLFNDEMEAIALGRMGLNELPAWGLKGYYGHTLGAAGVLETLLSMEAADDHTLPATKGFEHIGVSRKIGIADTPRQIQGTSFIKMMSGFGGCNASLLFRKGKEASPASPTPANRRSERTLHTVHITEREAIIDGTKIQTDGYGLALLKSLYHTQVGDYPKFHKMDILCKLGFIASELLLNAEAKSEGKTRFTPCEDRALLFVGRSASICADKAYQQTIENPDDYYPSPSSFIYTLPNILPGEIALRNKYYGETSYLAQESPECVEHLIGQLLRCTGVHSVLGGWIDASSTERFETTLY